MPRGRPSSPATRSAHGTKALATTHVTGRPASAWPRTSSSSAAGPAASTWRAMSPATRNRGSTGAHIPPPLSSSTRSLPRPASAPAPPPSPSPSPSPGPRRMPARRAVVKVTRRPLAARSRPRRRSGLTWLWNGAATSRTCGRGWAGADVMVMETATAAGSWLISRGGGLAIQVWCQTLALSGRSNNAVEIDSLGGAKKQ
ncbi:hypothetical protein GQ55_5G201800 [Panicum hallii var. hallii]|uniref:Uncharacterized protein n=1 Tax=Panicum hallii var. hallii TaxID=1504633 RepID=A0A2T7DI87_9POAL|nr:hypothetical protein GQ55_5G201800 [Panicum hallii var. hallii]